MVDLAASDRSFQQLADALPHIVWTHDADGAIDYLNERWFEYTGLPRHIPTEDDWSAVIPAGELTRLTALFIQARDSGQPYEVEHQLKPAAGDADTYRWFFVRVVPVRDARGAIVRWLGSATDVHDRHISYDRELDSYREIVEAIPEIAYIADPTGTTQFLNRRWFEFTGLTVEESLGAGAIDVVHPDDLPALLAAWQKSAATAERFEQTFRLRDASGGYRWFLGRSAPMHDADGRIVRWIGTSTNIDVEHRAQEALQFLFDSGNAFGTLLDSQLAARRVAQFAVPTIADGAIVFLAESDAAPMTVAAIATDPERTARLEALYRAYPGVEARPAITAFPTHGPRIINTIDESFYQAMGIDEKHRSMLRELALHAAVAVPLVARNRTLGYLSLFSTNAARQFGEADVRVIEAYAARAALAIDNARLYEREHAVADRFQRAALPVALPRIPGVRFDAVYLAGKDEAVVGGDWYDAFRIADGRVVISIGDVAGSGIAAAVTMAGMRQAIRGAAQIYADPVAVLNAADRALRSEDADRIVTAFVAIVDPMTSTLSYASAGHPPPFVRHPDGTIELLERVGLPLGLRTRDQSEPLTIELADGAMCVFYTDGLTESRRDVVGDEDRLRAVIADPAIAEDSHVSNAIVERMLEGSARDDVAVLVMRIGTPRDDRRFAPIGRWTFDATDARAAAAARRAFVDLFERSGVAHEQIALAELVLGELIGNVVRHGSGPVEIDVDWSDRYPVLHVLDQGPGFQHATRLPDDIMSEHGRGLYLIAALTEDFNVSRRVGRGSHARAVLPIRRGNRPPGVS